MLLTVTFALCELPYCKLYVATEVSLEEYMCYTTEETEKLELMRLTEKLGGNIELAIRQLADSKRSQVKGIGIT